MRKRGENGRERFEYAEKAVWPAVSKDYTYP